MRQRNILPGILILVVFACLPGCLLRKNRNRLPISMAAVKAVKPGVTTLGDVGRVLGAPNQIIWSNGVTTTLNGAQQDGITNTFTTQNNAIWPRAYHYRYTLDKTSGFTVIIFSIVSYDTKYDDVVVFFDKTGVVTDVGTSLNSGEASYNPFGD